MGQSALERELERLVEPVAERVVARLLAERGPAEPEQYVSVRTAAERPDLPEDTIRKWLQRGVVRKYKVGSCVRVKLSELVKEHDG
ncbi:MAG TPA: excisionase family DNA-binding protein [Pyrinomonadaceae bacterium]|jgi:excisionase family DNA binding protein